MSESALSVLQQKLLESQDNVTHFLENLVGEVIFADVICQHSINAGISNELAVHPGQVVTHRLAALTGSTTKQRYLYAESIFVPERLPERARAQLSQSKDPIGRVLTMHGMRLEREPLTQQWSLDTHTIITDRVLAAEVVWSWAYLLTTGGLAVFAIREWFLESVLQAVARRYEADDGFTPQLL